MEEFEQLYKLSDLTEEEYSFAKQQYQTDGRSKYFNRYLLSRSRLPNLRNLVRPNGELYAPVCYTSDYIVKYVKKPSWGLNGYISVICLWDLFFLDIDDKEQLPFVKKRIDRYYPDDLWYIHETTRGYHIYLLSRPISHISKCAIYMRKKLDTDPAHGTNGLYTGNSVRLTRKISEAEGAEISKYVERYGTGTEHPEALRLYKVVLYWLDYFRPGSDLIALSGLWKDMPSDFGKVHVEASAPLLLENGTCVENTGLTLMDDGIKNEWSRFKRYKTLSNMCDVLLLLVAVQYQMGFDNLYRIFEATNDYAVGVHVQHNTYFIAYRDLLFIDYDHKSRLGIIARFCRLHPGYVFRAVTTTKGYHVFLTSHPMVHDDPISLELLLTLRTDPAHLLGIYHRGYSVRINKKQIHERPYLEYFRYGKGNEDPRLLELYRLHLDLYQEHKDTPVCNYQIKITGDILKEEGPIKIF